MGSGLFDLLVLFFELHPISLNSSIKLPLNTLLLSFVSYDTYSFCKSNHTIIQAMSLLGVFLL